ncbi:HAMP domain-containing sensor histidine kinase [Clostridium beijerinckii]|uniref:HAMP domain-containing sensor histidine kinase n=1 Tax=Clostridium beijerinckii TaxID=1520 RepID=UPI00047D4329|nr:HAMP domain-containing sensor histidine kinase [Clostridium beijerinckii]
MNKNKTIKRNFYNLFLKIFIYTAISSAITYMILIITMEINNTKSTNYYIKYIDKINDDIQKNGDTILKGNLIDIKKYGEDIQGEVIDLSGNHLYGEYNIKNDNFNILNSINQDKYDNNYTYRYIPVTQNNSIQAIYVIKAPFDFVTNNYKTNMGVTFIYMLFMISPIIYFLLYLFLFTSKLYKSISKNITILLDGAQKISDGDLDFNIEGTSGIEFNKIQESFNDMVKVLKSTIKDLSDLDAERRMMVSSIAHDIRTPITVIKGQIEIIYNLKDSPDYKIDDNMRIINKNCDRMTTLTDNLSLFYKVEGENFLFRNEEVNLKELLEYKQIEIQSIADKKNVAIEFKTNLMKPKYVLDSSMLFRVLDNILYNSLRFTQEGEITLEAYDDMEKINFKCTDTGTGFKQEDTSKLFTAFYQDEDYKSHFGLGLYIAQKIIKNFKGKVKAYNNEFGGAVIEFYIKELDEYYIH